MACLSGAEVGERAGAFRRSAALYDPGRAGEHVLCHQRRLTALLREATGLEDAQAEWRPWSGATWSSATMMLNTTLGTRSTHGSRSRSRPGASPSPHRPAELKQQAEALYRTSRVGGSWS